MFVLRNTLFNGDEMTTVLMIISIITLVLSGVGLVIFILLHSGKGTGVSDAIASSMYSTQSGTSLVEKNLDRVTIICAAVFAVSLFVMMIVYPLGTINSIQVDENGTPLNLGGQTVPAPEEGAEGAEAGTEEGTVPAEGETGEASAEGEAPAEGAAPAEGEAPAEDAAPAETPAE